MVRKSAMRVLVVMGLLTTGAGCSVLKEDSDDLPDLVVAASLELSGLNDEVGKAHQNALTLRAEQINASGVLGSRRLRVVTVDNRSDPAVAVSQVTEFARDTSVSAVVVGACSQCGVAAGAVAVDRQVPMISLAPANAVVTAPADKRNFLFKVGPNGPDNGRALIGEMTADLAPSARRKVAVLYPDDVYGTDAGATMRAVTPNTPVDVVGEAKYRADGSDLGDKARLLVADKPAASRPDAVLVWSLPAQAGPAAKAVKDAGFTGKIYFDSAAAGSLFLKSPAVEGATIVFPQTLAMDDVIATTPAKAARKQWFEEYTARYGAYHGQASFAADALQLVVDAVARVGTGRAAIQGVLESLETDGLSGPLRMTAANHSGLMPQALEAFVVQGGRWHLLG